MDYYPNLPQTLLPEDYSSNLQKTHTVSLCLLQKSLTHSLEMSSAVAPIICSLHLMLFQIFLCPVTQGPCSCLCTLLKMQKRSTPHHPSFFQAAQGCQKDKTTAPTGVTNVVMQDCDLHLQLQFSV